MVGLDASTTALLLLRRDSGRWEFHCAARALHIFQSGLSEQIANPKQLTYLTDQVLIVSGTP